MRKFLTVLSLAAFMLVLFSGIVLAQDDIVIAVSTKGPGAGNPFWAAVERGATAAAADFGVTVNLIASPAETDVAGQLALIEDQLAQGADALVVAPTDSVALNPVFEQAVADGVPVLYIDTSAEFDGALTFIGTDNLFGASLGAQYLCDNLPQGAKVAILQGVMSHQTGIDRATGGHDGLAACGLNIVAELSANWDRAQGQSVTEDILTGNPDLAGIFASNDNMALGAVEALKSAGVLDSVIVVGFDANPDAAASILAGEMSATVAQNPYNMGVLGVQNAILAILGHAIPTNIDTGTLLVTEANAADFTE
jgi:ribose transport system substrate-binding protein